MKPGESAKQARRAKVGWRGSGRQPERIHLSLQTVSSSLCWSRLAAVSGLQGAASVERFGYVPQ